MDKKIISALVENHPGITARITSLYLRRGYNIESFTGATTDYNDISRITIVVQGDEDILEQIIAQTSKLEEIKEVKALAPENCFVRELVLIKLQVSSGQKQDVEKIAAAYGAEWLEESGEIMILQYTDTPERINEILQDFSAYNIVTVCRTGVTAISK